MATPLIPEGKTLPNFDEIPGIQRDIQEELAELEDAVRTKAARARVNELIEAEKLCDLVINKLEPNLQDACFGEDAHRDRAIAAYTEVIEVLLRIDSLV